MKNLKLAALTLTLIGIFGAGNAVAVDTATLTVTANVAEACQFDSDGLLEFGTLDALNPTNISNHAATTNPTFKCTNGATYAITDNSASNSLTNGTDSIAYTLGYTAGGTATGNSQTLAVTGSILAVNYAGVSAGSYAASVTLSINP